MDGARSAGPEEAAGGPGGEQAVELVASVLLERYPALVAFGELTAELEGVVTAAAARDALGELERLGLVHSLGEFHFASWAAMRARQLGI